MKMQNFLKGAKLATVKGLAALAMTFNSISSYAQSPPILQETEKPHRQGEAYLLGGKGTASNEGGDTKYYFRFGIREQVMGNIWAGVEYLNEGHPELVGHRDGFAVPLWYFIPIGKEEKFRLEIGGGLYGSMNTITRGEDKQEYNDKDIGLLLALGASYKLSDRTRVMVQANEVIMSGFNSFAVTAGLGLDLDEASYQRRFSEKAEKLYSLSFLGGPSVTTRGDAKTATGYKINLRREIPEISKRLAFSGSFNDEGDSGLSSRKGVAGQFWFIAPRISWLELSAGFGPYFVRERNPNIECNEVMTIASIDARVILTDNFYLEFMFDRGISNKSADSNKNVDQDNFFFGGGLKF